ncbi:MAG: cytochrome c3 family protein [Planctomycetota bacterium]
MERSKLSRDFSGRVEVNFHRHPNLFRRTMWLVSLLVAVLAVAGLAWNARFGRPEIYHGGSLSKSHQMFENRCEACHRPWTGPLDRLLSLGRAAEATSVADEACQACHAGAGHFFTGGNSIPWEQKATAVHLSQSHNRACASCHREHQGEVELRQIAGASCVGCHADMVTARLKAPQLESLTFQRGGEQRIADFEGHPDLAIHELLKAGTLESTVLPAHGARSVLEYFQRVGETKTVWQDRGRLRFNHALHLRESGVADVRGETHVLRNDCSSCHEPTEDGRYMLPIRYENHCSSCHPLVFDPGLVQDASGEIFELDWGGTGSSGGTGEGRIRSRRDPGQAWGLEELRGRDGRFRLLTAPHRAAVEVRGYLTDVYAAQALREVAGDVPSAGGQADVGRPGRSIAAAELPQLSGESKALISRQTAAAEELVQSANFPRGTGEEIPGLFRSLGWLQGSGGCRYCHETDDGVPEGELDAGLFVAGAAPLPAIRRPRLPDRWFPHSEFDHDAHRMMSCVDCHSGNGALGEGPDIYGSRSTGDVLMPGMQLCRKCHVQEPSIGADLESAGGNCLECHIYHQRQFESEHSRGLEQLLKASE